MFRKEEDAERDRATLRQEEEEEGKQEEEKDSCVFGEQDIRVHDRSAIGHRL